MSDPDSQSTRAVHPSPISPAGNLPRVRPPPIFHVGHPDPGPPIYLFPRGKRHLGPPISHFHLGQPDLGRRSAYPPPRERRPGSTHRPFPEWSPPPGWTRGRFPRFSGRDGRNYLSFLSVVGVGGVGVSPPPPLSEAWLGAMSSKCRSCWARSRGKSCLMAPMLLS